MVRESARFGTTEEAPGPWNSSCGQGLARVSGLDGVAVHGPCPYARGLGMGQNDPTCVARCATCPLTIAQVMRLRRDGTRLQPDLAAGAYSA